MARQDMASSLEETSRTVDSVQCVGARNERYTTALERWMTLKLNWRKQNKNRLIRSVLWENIRNFTLPPRMSLMEFVVKRR